MGLGTVKKRSILARSRFDPNPAPERFDYATARRQSQAAALVLRTSMQSSKWLENLGGIFWIDPDSIVFDREDVILIAQGRRYQDFRWSIRPILYGIRDHVLKQAEHRAIVGAYHW